MNALHRESRDVQWHTGIPGAEKLRVQPTVARLLDEARPATVSRSDHLLFGALETVMTMALKQPTRYRAARLYIESLLKAEAKAANGAAAQMDQRHNGPRQRVTAAVALSTDPR